MKPLNFLPAILLMTMTSGCMYELRDQITDCKINCYNKMMAMASYREMDTACMGISCPHSFKEGYFQGYKDVANGGTGCVPAVPQIRLCNHMWLDFCSENEKMGAWYDGYEFGAMAAKSEGMADVNRVITRVPMQTPIDYGTPSGTGQPTPVPEGVPETAVPPTPNSEYDGSEPQQTRRLPKSIFE